MYIKFEKFILSVSQRRLLLFYLMKSTKGRLATNMSIKTDIAIIKLANKTRLQLLKHKLYKHIDKKKFKNTLHKGAKIELVRDCLKLLRLAKLVGSRGNLFHIPTILLEKKELRTDFLETTCINWYVCPRKFIPFLWGRWGSSAVVKATHLGEGKL